MLVRLMYSKKLDKSIYNGMCIQLKLLRKKLNQNAMVIYAKVMIHSFWGTKV